MFIIYLQLFYCFLLKYLDVLYIIHVKCIKTLKHCIIMGKMVLVDVLTTQIIKHIQNAYEFIVIFF